MGRTEGLMRAISGFWALRAGFGFLLVWMGVGGFFVNPFGLSLISLWSIRVAPVRGGTHFLCRRKESKQRKRAHTGGL
jgi:hypothetical protein